MYLSPSNLCESNDPKIRELSKRIAGGSSGEEAAKKLFLWVRDNVKWDVLPVVGAKGVISRNPMAGECADKNNVFVALARAAGIPARYVMVKSTLKSHNPAFKKAVVPHVGGQVQINGKWIMADPSYGKDTVGLVDLCEFGKPIWIKPLEKHEMTELPKPMFPDGVNEMMQKDPLAKQLKDALKMVRKE